MKNYNKMTREESGKVLQPLKSFRSPRNPCRYNGRISHVMKVHIDGQGRRWVVCDRCCSMPVRMTSRRVPHEQ